MSKTKADFTNLTDIYSPLFENIVVEYHILEKTKGGIHLNPKDLKELQKNESPIMKVVAIGPKITNLKVGDYILPSPNCRALQVPLIYTDGDAGTQHAQLHISEIMGIVTEEFALLCKSNTKESIIN